MKRTHVSSFSRGQEGSVFLTVVMTETREVITKEKSIDYKARKELMMVASVMGIIVGGSKCRKELQPPSQYKAGENHQFPICNFICRNCLKREQKSSAKAANSIHKYTAW